LAVSGRVQLESLISAVVPLAKIRRALELSFRKDTVMQVQIDALSPS
jgi:hypothetical protein